MTHEEAQEFYNEVCLKELPDVRNDFAECVARFKNGYFESGPANCVGDHEESFAYAVRTMKRLLPTIRDRNRNRA